MTRWALIQGGVIANVVEQDGQPQADGQWIACGDAGPGWAWDGVGFSAPPSAPPEPRRISVGAFFDRLGPAKWAILADASPLVQAVVKDASVRTYIDLDNPDLPAGLAIVAAGHTIDVAAITGAPVMESERPGA